MIEIKLLIDGKTEEINIMGDYFFCEEGGLSVYTNCEDPPIAWFAEKYVLSAINRGMENGAE